MHSSFLYTEWHLNDICWDFSFFIHRNLNISSFRLSSPGCKRKKTISSRRLLNLSCSYFSEESEARLMGTEPSSQTKQHYPSQVPGSLVSSTSPPWVVNLHPAALGVRDTIRYNVICPLQTAEFRYLPYWFLFCFYIFSRPQKLWNYLLSQKNYPESWTHWGVNLKPMSPQQSSSSSPWRFISTPNTLQKRKCAEEVCHLWMGALEGTHTRMRVLFMRPSLKSWLTLPRVTLFREPFL